METNLCLGYLFEALSLFAFVCWAAPTNVPVNQLFGVRSGLGMSVLTFDWTQISWIGSPLMSKLLIASSIIYLSCALFAFLALYFPFALLYLSSRFPSLGVLGVKLATELFGRLEIGFHDRRVPLFELGLDGLIMPSPLDGCIICTLFLRSVLAVCFLHANDNV